MNCENSNTTVHFVCPAWSTLMFLVLVCLFVMMSSYKTALTPVLTSHLVVFHTHTHTCKYSQKISSTAQVVWGTLSSWSQHILLKRVRLRVSLKTTFPTSLLQKSLKDTNKNSTLCIFAQNARFMC